MSTPEFDGLQAAETVLSRAVASCPYEQCFHGALCVRCLANALTRAFQLGLTAQITMGQAGQLLQEAILSSYAAGVQANRERVLQILGSSVPDLCARCEDCPCGIPQGLQAGLRNLLQESRL